MCNFFLACFSCDNFSADNCKISCTCDHISKACRRFIFVFAAELKPVVSTLTRLFDETSTFLGGGKAPPAKKREIEDNSRKLGALFVKLNSADLSDNASKKLVQLCQAINGRDYTAAMQIQVLLTV